MPQSTKDTIHYKVKPGDTIHGLAIKFNTDIWEIKRSNRLITIDLFEGQSLVIHSSKEPDEHVQPDNANADISQSRLLKFDVALCFGDQSEDSAPPMAPIAGTMVVTPTVLMFDEQKTASNEQIISKANQQHVSLLFQISLLKTVTSYDKVDPRPTEKDRPRRLSTPSPWSTQKTSPETKTPDECLSCDCLLTLHQTNDIHDIPVVFITDRDSSQSLRLFLKDCCVDGETTGDEPVFREIQPNESQKYKWHNKCLYTLNWQLDRLKTVEEKEANIEEHIESILSGDSRIIEIQQVMRLSQYLPSFLVHGCRPADLIFSTNLHGYHAPTLYRKMGEFEDGPNLIFVLSDSGDVFGALISANLHPRDGFYGSGESMLFTIKPELNCYHWTGDNEFFIHCNVSGFGIGSGKGCYGLWIDQSLRSGSSNNCSTYANEKLTLNGEWNERGVEFGMLEMEVWSFAYLKDEASFWSGLD